MGRQGSGNSRQNEAFPSSACGSLPGRCSLVVTRKTTASSPAPRNQTAAWQLSELQIAKSKDVCFSRKREQQPPTSERRGRSLNEARGDVCLLQRAEWSRSPGPTLLVLKGSVKPIAAFEGRIFKWYHCVNVHTYLNNWRIQSCECQQLFLCVYILGRPCIWIPMRALNCYLISSSKLYIFKR